MTRNSMTALGGIGHWTQDGQIMGVLAHPSILDRVMEKEAAAQEKKYRDKRYL